MIEWINLLITYFPDFVDGLIVSLKLTLTGVGIGALIGLPLAVSRVYGGKWIQRIAIGYIELFRGTPLLVQLFVIYFGLPDLGITFSRTTAALLALGLNSAAYQAEYFRGAIQAIGSGQMVAARSIGMDRFKAIRHIILPQALRVVIPPWSNEPILLMKASAVVFIIAVPDLMTEAKLIITRIYDPIGIYLIVALFYLVIVMLLTAVINLFEKKLRIPGLEIDASRR
jgi:polar amino acid transport system permease protein